MDKQTDESKWDRGAEAGKPTWMPQSQARARTHFMISAKPIASSTPGIANARSCIIAPIPPLWSATQARQRGGPARQTKGTYMTRSSLAGSRWDRSPSRPCRTSAKTRRTGCEPGRWTIDGRNRSQPMHSNTADASSGMATHDEKH
jgi:hypothetical protein